MREEDVSKVKFVQMNLPVRYEDDDIPKNYPYRDNEMWNITVDADNGQIQEWPKGTPAIDIYMKVTDMGHYFLLDEHRNELASIEEDYAPDSHSIPGKYGDYIDFKVNDYGVITNWYANPTYDEFIDDEDEEY